MGRGAGTESADEQAANQWRIEDGSMKLSFWERPETFWGEKHNMKIQGGTLR